MELDDEEMNDEDADDNADDDADVQSVRWNH